MQAARVDARGCAGVVQRLQSRLSADTTRPMRQYLPGDLLERRQAIAPLSRFESGARDQW